MSQLEVERGVAGRGCSSSQEAMWQVQVLSRGKVALRGRFAVYLLPVSGGVLSTSVPSELPMYSVET